MCIGGFAIRKIKTQRTINIKTVISVYRNYMKIKKFWSMFHTNGYTGQLQLTSIMYTKVKVLPLSETMKEKSTFRAKALRWAFARNVDFSFIVSGSERTFTFRVSLNTLPTLATSVRDIITNCVCSPVSKKS